MSEKAHNKQFLEGDMRNGDLAIFAIPDNLQFGERVCKSIGRELGHLTFKSFADGEHWCQFEDVRGRDHFIIGSTNPPADHPLQILLAIDAAKRASASRITVVIPYFGYSRQDSKDRGRTPISAKAMADVLTKAGIHRILTMDLHNPSIQGFFDCPVDHLLGNYTLMPVAQGNIKGEIIAVAPDAGATKMLARICNRLSLRQVMIGKERQEANQIDKICVYADIKAVLASGGKLLEGKSCLLIDDMVDTAGTMTRGAMALMDYGAESVYAVATHALLSGKAIEEIEKSPITTFWVTDSMRQFQPEIGSKIKMVSVAPVFGEAIRRIHNEESLSSMFQ